MKRIKQLLLWLQSKLKRETVFDWLKKNSCGMTMGKKSVYFHFRNAVVRYSDHFANSQKYDFCVLITEKVFILYSANDSFKKPFVFSKRDMKGVIFFLKTFLFLKSSKAGEVESFEEIKSLKEDIFKTKTEDALEAKKQFCTTDAGWEALYNIISNLKEYASLPRDIKEQIKNLIQFHPESYTEIYAYVATVVNSSRTDRQVEFYKIYSKYQK